MITDLQRQQRNMGVGASECAAVLGMDPWRSAYDLWILKTEKHIQTGEQEESEAAEIGNLIEGTTAQLAERRLGCKLVKPKATYKAENNVMFANLDRQLEKAARGSANCELKSTGVIEGWGEPGTDEVPERVLIQVTAQMLCSDARISHIARLLGRFGLSFSMYKVEYNPRLAQMIEEQVCDFWTNCVEKDIPPSDSRPSLPVISHIRRTLGKTVQVPIQAVERFTTLRDERKAVEALEEQAKADLLAALGDAEIGLADGYSVSFKSIKKTTLDTEAIRREHPELAAQFTKSSEYRRLDVREKKHE